VVYGVFVAVALAVVKKAASASIVGSRFAISAAMAL
jgi:hypothetical protein